MASLRISGKKVAAIETLLHLLQEEVKAFYKLKKNQAKLLRSKASGRELTRRMIHFLRKT
jgi:hypothetical protein